MFRRLFFLSTLLLIPSALAACAPAPTATPADTKTPAVELPAPPTETADKPVASPAPTEITGPQMECTMVSNQPEASPELEAILGVKENDWVYGPETAAVTIVEYADFQ